MLSSSAEKNSILLVTSMVLVIAAGVTAVQAWKVQIVPKVTSVKYVVPVVTSFTTVPSTCYVPMNVTGDCRRRRSIEEKPDIISLGDDIDVENIIPTLPRLEASAIPDEFLAPSIEASRDEESSNAGRSTKRGWTFTARPLDFTKGLTKGYTKVNRWINNNRPYFGLTYVDFQTVTVTQTTMATVTDGQKSFAISGCLPSGFAYTIC